MGKGDKQRPFDANKYHSNFDEINWRNSTEGRRIVGLAFVGDMDALKEEITIQNKKIKLVKTPKGKATRYVY